MVLQTVDVGRLSVSEYDGVAPASLLDALEAVARPLRGVRILHLNATPYGGGVSELLRSAVPVLRGLGIEADWRIISGDPAFFDATKRIHNALQGAPEGVTPAHWAHYEATARQNAAQLRADAYDVVFVHDPQPAALPAIAGRGRSRWIWRCHIDTSAPEPAAWQRLSGFLDRYDAAVFTMPEFGPARIPVPRVDLIPPAIDPLSPKNRKLPTPLASDVLNWIGIDVDLPLMTQVSRFDPWKDPMGVIETYRRVRDLVPGLQLAMVGSMALDDPQGWKVYRDIAAHAVDDPAIHLFTNLTGVGNIEVNAFQAESDVVVQKSIREGFGLVVSEAMWKGTPVVAGDTGGIPLQTADGAGGILVDSVEECAAAVAALLADPARGAGIARAGRERVRSHFLLPRLILDDLALVRDLLEGHPVRTGVGRDPVCGMTLTEPTGVTADEAGAVVTFCSRRCRAIYERSRPVEPTALRPHHR
jgi:trehalose synthase